MKDWDPFIQEVTEAGGEFKFAAPIGNAVIIVRSKAFGDDLETLFLVDGFGPFTMSTYFTSGHRKGKEFTTPLTPTHFAVLKAIEKYAPKLYEMRGILDTLDALKEENNGLVE